MALRTTATRPLRSAIEPSSGPRAPWRDALPVWRDATLALREVEIDDAPSLMAHLGTADVSRFISAPPSTLAGFERFIAWSQQDRQAGRSACVAIVPAGQVRAIGLFQLRSLDARFANAEWGFALGSAYWGSGLFVAGSTQMLDFAFDTIGVVRLEARAVVVNGRGNGALRKIGAVQEGVLRRSFFRRGQHYDQVLWSMLSEDWQRRRSQQGSRIH
jgi:[ribosomal protein S5]-alanine N-acetyltransferase